MTTFARAALLAALMSAAPLAAAKGIFQAEGTLSGVQRSGDTIVFRFAGDISFGFASAPDSSPKRRWRDARWQGVSVTVRLADWTRRNKPGEKGDGADAQRIHAELSEAAKRGTAIRFSIDNPGLAFSNSGQLTRVTGTYLYLAPSPPAP